MYFIIILYILVLTTSLKINHKFCINCKYLIPDNLYNNKYSKCSLFPCNSVNYLVTGNENIKNFYYCSTARASDSMCGINATKYKKIRKSKN